MNSSLAPLPCLEGSSHHHGDGYSDGELRPQIQLQLSNTHLSGLSSTSNGVDLPKPKYARTHPAHIAALKAPHSPLNPESWEIFLFPWQSAQGTAGLL